MAESLKAFAVTVSPAGNHKRRSRRVVLAKNKAAASKMAQVYPGDQCKVATAGFFEGLGIHLKGSRKPDGRDLRSFYGEILSSLRADPSLATAFRDVLPTLEHPVLATATVAAIDAIDRSEGPDKMLDAFHKVLPTEHIERLRAAQHSGGVPEVVEILNKSADKGVKIKTKISQALFMPGITLVGAIGSGIFLSMTQLPAMAQLFKGSKAPMPAPTQALLSCVDFMKAFPLVGVLVTIAPILAIIFAPQIYRTSPRLQDLVDRLPYFGPLINQLRWVKVLRTLSMLLESNMTYEKALAFTIKSVDHYRTKHFLIGVKDTIALKSVDLYAAARANEERLGNVDTRWIRLLPLGAKSGSMTEVLNTSAVIYEERSEERMEKLPQILGLIAFIFSAVIIGFVSMASVLPGFRLMTVFK